MNAPEILSWLPWVITVAVFAVSLTGHVVKLLTNIKTSKTLLWELSSTRLKHLRASQNMDGWSPVTHEFVKESWLTEEFHYATGIRLENPMRDHLLALQKSLNGQLLMKDIGRVASFTAVEDGSPVFKVSRLETFSFHYNRIVMWSVVLLVIPIIASLLHLISGDLVSQALSMVGMAAFLTALAIIAALDTISYRRVREVIQCISPETKLSMFKTTTVPFPELNISSTHSSPTPEDADQAPPLPPQQHRSLRHKLCRAFTGHSAGLSR